MRWAGIVAGETRNIKRILISTPLDKHKIKWKGDIKIDLMELNCDCDRA
jgi:hypothetical protein